LWQALGGRGFALLGLGEEDIPKMTAWAEERGATFPLLADDTTYERYDDPGPGNYALEVVVDREGIVRFVDHGSTTAELAAQIEPLL
jgi:peroxiredoxin